MTSLDIFASSHPIHDQKWCVESICTACLIELLEDFDQPQVKKKVFASEFLRLLNEQNSRLALLFQSDDQVTFHTALLIIGKLDDVIEEFLNSYERDENHSQSSFYDVGLALVFLLFSCYFHGNRCIGPVRLQSTVLTFLRLQQSRSELPLCIVKCSTYLLALLHFLDRGFQKDIESLASNNIACLKSLVSLLTEHDDLRIVLMSSDIIKSMLSSFKFRSSETVKHSNLNTILYTAADVNLARVSLLLGVLDSTENGPCGRAVLHFLDSFIPDTLQRTFLLPDKRLSVSNLSVCLNILTFLQKCHMDAITVQDLKLASYVLAILKPDEFYRFLKDESLLKLLDNSIIYLNALLVKSVQHEDDRTAILLATNCDLMKFLNLAINAKLEIDLIGEKVLFCTSLLVAACISSSSFKTSNRLGIDLDNLLLNKHTNTKSQLSLVTRKEKLNSEQENGLPFNIDLVRSVYIAAQNCAMMENEVTSNTAVNCLTGIFDLVDGFVDIKHHFQNQAWNQFLLDMVLVRCSCSGQPGSSRHVPTSQLRLCSLLLSRAPDLFLHQKRLNSLLGYFCLMSAGSLTVEHQAIWIQIINQIIGRNDTKTCDAELVEKAKAKIQEIEEVTVQENAYSFIQLATIIHQMLHN